MVHKYKFLALALLLPVFSLEAASITTRTCLIKFIQKMNVKENGEKAFALNMYEIKLEKPLEPIFGERKLHVLIEPQHNGKLPIFKRPTPLKLMRKLLYTETKFVPDIPTEQFMDIMVTDAKYTYIIQDRKMTFARTGTGVVDKTSKHALMSAIPEDGPIRLGGEMWKDKNGVLHFDPSSGTFTPTNDDLKKGEIFFGDYMGVKKFESHPFYPSKTPPVPKAPAPGLDEKLAEAQELMDRVKSLVPSSFTSADEPIQSGVKAEVKWFDTQEIVAAEGEVVVLKDAQGKDVSYRLKQLHSFAKEQVIMNSNQTRGKIVRNVMYKSNLAKANGYALSTQEEVHQNNTYRPVQGVKTEVVQMGLFPVSAPKDATTPAFVASFEKTSTAKPSQKATLKYQMAIEDNGTQVKPRLDQVETLTKQFEKRFKITETQAN